MKDHIKISLVQTNLYWEDKRKNLRLFEKKILSVKRSDVIILPEMFTTGFSMNTAKLAESWEGSYTLYWMQEMAQRSGADIVGSYIVRNDDKYYNRLVWASSDGQVWHYDKRHLFTLAGEHNHYTSGNERLIIDRFGWKIMPLVCYDVRFPVWSRNDGSVDMMVYVSNFPAKRKDAWTTLLKARAIENQVYVAGVNIIGENNGVAYNGGSYMYDYTGQVLEDCKDKDKVTTVTIEKKLQQEFRKNYAFLQDSDRFKMC